jgi:DNA-binding NtrC family response regulator
MPDPLDQLCQHKHIGLMELDAQLVPQQVNDVARALVRNMGRDLYTRDLYALFPELVGNEKPLQAIIDGEQTLLALDHINIVDAHGNTCYLNLTVLPHRRNQQALLLIEDVTPQAKLLQERNQQRFELLLYKGIEWRKQHFVNDSILGTSVPIQNIRATIAKLNRAPFATVLLLGESGTGKSLAAQVIHYSAMSIDAPLVHINCAALPENLIEAELFGYEKGAFTHATTARAGLLEEADGGTIFLDEIGELPLNLQAKLLAVLETKTFRRLGGNQPISVNARVIAATNKDLQTEVVHKRFREDLFFRLNVVSIQMPALRKLGDDVVLIAEHLLKIFNVEFKRRVKGFTAEARQSICSYGWPGNVRELANCIERAMIFVEGDRIDAPDLVITRLDSGPQASPWVIPPTGVKLEAVERQLIQSALEQARGNKSQAARLLGLTRDTLRYRLEKYDLDG